VSTANIKNQQLKRSRVVLFVDSYHSLYSFRQKKFILSVYQEYILIKPVAGLPVAGLPVAGLPVAGLPVAGLPKAVYNSRQR